jgi:hypothetical protein
MIQTLRLRPLQRRKVSGKDTALPAAYALLSRLRKIEYLWIYKHIPQITVTSLRQTRLPGNNFIGINNSSAAGTIRTLYMKYNRLIIKSQVQG